MCIKALKPWMFFLVGHGVIVDVGSFWKQHSSGQDVLSKGERSQIRAELLQEWQNLNDMFVHEEQEKLESHEQLPSKCAQLGLCVCDGAGLQCWVYHERLVWFLKPHFTPRRVRRQRDAEGRMVHVELPPAEKQAQSKLKSNRKALEDGFVVVRIRLTDSETLPAHIPLCASVHPSWGRLGLESLGYRSVASEASTDCLWLHLGHVNYSTWSMAVLRLEPDGGPDERGYQRLEVPNPPEARAFRARLFVCPDGHGFEI